MCAEVAGPRKDATGMLTPVITVSIPSLSPAVKPVTVPLVGTPSALKPEKLPRKTYTSPVSASLKVTLVALWAVTTDWLKVSRK